MGENHRAQRRRKGAGQGGDQPTGHANPSLVPTTGIIADPAGVDLDGTPQVEQVPVGGVDTGVALEPAESSGAATVAGGLILVSAGGAVLMRRRPRTP